MKTLSLIVLVLSFTFAAPVMAYDAELKYSVQALISCGAWVKERKEDSWTKEVYTAWITGYITAYNRQTPDVYSILGSADLESVLLWMDKYCQENPLSILSRGMDVLTDELWPNRKRTEDD